MSYEDEKEKKPITRMSVAQSQAAEKGCVVVLPEPNQLFVDIDDEAGLLTYETGLRRFQRRSLVTAAEIHPSPSGKPGRFHAVVTLTRPVRDAEERILLQLLLGSDVVRETISYERAKRNDPTPTLFFEKAP